MKRQELMEDKWPQIRMKIRWERGIWVSRMDGYVLLRGTSR